MSEKIEALKDRIAAEMGYTNYLSLSNGVKCGNIKQRYLEECLNKVIVAYADDKYQEGYEFGKCSGQAWAI